VSDEFDSEKRVPVAEERLSVRKRTVETGRVRVRTVIDEHQQWVREDLVRENVLVQHVPVGREIETVPQMREEGDTLVIPVVEEVLITEKRLVLKEEIHIRRQREIETVEAPVTLRSMRAVIERDEPPASEDCPNRC
jgi:uncharacterized protein (TIGR02271 family)